MKATIKSVSNGVCVLEIPSQYTEYLAKLQDKTVEVEIDQYFEKRSNKANAYAWALISQIANAVEVSKDDIYLDVIKHYGQRQQIVVDNDVNLESYGIKYYEVDYEDEFTTEYTVYQRSSEMNAKEMSILIKGIEHEAEQLNIPTKSSEEVERYLNEIR